MSYLQVIKDTQKAARAVTKETGKPGKERTMKNVAGKARKLDNPYAQWTDPRTGWEYKLLKSWQADNSKEHGRWFVAVKSPATFGSWEMGDEYVKGGIRVGLAADGYSGDARSLVYDQTVWGSVGEFYAWAWGER